MGTSSYRIVVCLSWLLGAGCLPESQRLASDAESLRAGFTAGTHLRTRIALPLLSRPDGQSQVLWTLPENSKVVVLDGPAPGGWYEVGADGGRWGHVPGDALQPVQAQRLFRLPTTGKIASLTFDVPTDEGHIAYLLDNLSLLGVKASFSVTAEWVRAHPQLLVRMVQEGHGILNGALSPRAGTAEPSEASASTYEARARALWRTHAAVLELTGVSTKPFFRSPAGAEDESLLWDASSRGYDFDCKWSLDSRTWWGLPLDERVNRAVRETTPGTIFVFQTSTESSDALVVSRVVETLRDQGYRFALLTDFVGEGGHPQTKALAHQLTYLEGGIVRGPRHEKKLSLVFTGGYHAEGAPEILDALAARRLRGSFFLTGDFIRLYPELTERIVRDGHYVGPHSDAHLLYASWDDVQHTLVTEDEFNRDLEKNLADLAAFGPTVESMRFWIPPFEWYNQQITDWSRARQRVLVRFTEGTNTEYDWVPESKASHIPSRKLLDGVFTYESSHWQGLNGFLILIHLGSGPDRQDKFAPYVPELLDTLAQRGYAFVGVDTLLEGSALPR